MLRLSQFSTDISRLCAQYGVNRLYAFGSVLTKRFNEESDVDLIVDFQPMDLSCYADNYYALKQALEELLHKPVDLLEDQAIRNPYFRQAINSQRQLIYGH